jgi:hypothetical protein
MDPWTVPGNGAPPKSVSDEGDAWPGGFSKSVPSQTPGAIPVRMPVERDSEIYNMNHRRRGIAFIFNHMNFDQRLGLKMRNGTNADRDNLRMTLRGLDFDVRVHNDLNFKVMSKCV